MGPQLGYPIPKSMFPDLDPTLVHFAGGGQTPVPDVVAPTIAAFLTRKAGGQPAYREHWELVARARRRTAALMHCAMDDVGFLGSASDGIARTVNAVEWRAGDNAVIASDDYASGRAALESLGRRSVTLRRVNAPHGAGREDALLDACDGRTRLLYVSQVNPFSGRRMDVAALHRVLAPRGTIVLNDATHAVGALPVRAAEADVTVASTYKFLCASFMGILAFGTERARALRPAGAGWYSETADGASRFEYGNVPHLDVVILDAVLEWHARGDEDARARHLLAVANALEQVLENRGLVAFSRDGDTGSHNVCVAGKNVKEIADGLEAQGVRVWYDHGRMRLSAQVFNAREDIDAFDAALGTVLHSTDGKERRP
ncbi:aminotransferase class V-fold PLP-dependent enzyme [Pararhizobium mangrovi]|uniref:Aminotransferase class V-fold PLP-dependent enzyme n=1 Tax=Pararhizobium mangrovi TaxID=2590452 RepID=A0A506U4S5_9HYPH|nr:aminotransferase class V-fold PLP-dependent enzyme [Pararhizobium mangrovi]TPW27549.1 aminotransferase class V-fold PLP-dependent enzyme [Pararhizobium mangrovi]